MHHAVKMFFPSIGICWLLVLTDGSTLLRYRCSHSNSSYDLMSPTCTLPIAACWFWLSFPAFRFLSVPSFYETTKGWVFMWRVAGVWSRAGCTGYRDRSEGDDSSSKVVQDEQLVRRHSALCRLQVEHLTAIAACRHQVCSPMSLFDALWYNCSTSVKCTGMVPWYLTRFKIWW